MVEKKKKGKQDKVWKRTMLYETVDWGGGALAGTSCPAASPMWVFAHANTTHAHLQRLVLLLLLGCSGAGRLCIQTPIKPCPLWFRTGLHHSDFT